MSGDYGFGGGMSEEEQIALALQLSQETSHPSSGYQSSQSRPSGNVPKNSRLRELPFNSSNYASKLREGFGNLFKQPTGSDVMIELKHNSGTEKIYCHSLVLSVWSETFRILLQSAVPEEVEESVIAPESSISEETELQSRKKQKSDDEQMEVENKPKSFKKVIRLMVDEMNIPAFRLMIEYLYKGTVSVDEDRVISLIAVAHEYNLEPLKDACVSVLGNHINQDNVFSLLAVVDRYECHGLRLKVADYLAKNFQQLRHTGVLLQLDLATMKELVQSDDLMADTEDEVFKAVINYGEQFDEEQKKKIYDTLLPFVRFALMDPKAIVDIEENTKLNGIPTLQRLIFEAYRHKAHPSAATSLRTEPRRGMRKLIEMQEEFNRYKPKGGRYKSDYQ